MNTQSNIMNCMVTLRGFRDLPVFFVIFAFFSWFSWFQTSFSHSRNSRFFMSIQRFSTANSTHFHALIFFKPNGYYVFVFFSWSRFHATITLEPFYVYVAALKIKDCCKTTKDIRLPSTRAIYTYLQLFTLTYVYVHVYKKYSSESVWVNQHPQHHD